MKKTDLGKHGQLVQRLLCDTTANDDIMGEIPHNAFLDDDHWYWSTPQGAEMEKKIIKALWETL